VKTAYRRSTWNSRESVTTGLFDMQTGKAIAWYLHNPQSDSSCDIRDANIEQDLKILGYVEVFPIEEEDCI
jgi:hypothetical protein